MRQVTLEAFSRGLGSILAHRRSGVNQHGHQQSDRSCNKTHAPGMRTVRGQGRDCPEVGKGKVRQAVERRRKTGRSCRNECKDKKKRPPGRAPPHCLEPRKCFD
eukprot:scaffold68808_cov66-Phaeocystis_antarctica.AAC.3